MGNIVKVKSNTEIQKIIETYDFSEKLSNDETAIVKASLYPSVSRVETKLFVIELTKITTKTLFDSGFKFDEEEKANVIMTVADDVLRDFKHITIEEIKICFRKGVRGEYGEFFGLSVITFYNWLRKYTTEIRGKAITKQREYEAEKERLRRQKVYSEEEKVLISYNAIIWVYNDWLENNNLFDIDNSTYECLVKYDILKLDRSQKNEIYKKAKQRLMKKHSSEKPTGFKSRNTIQQLIKNIQSENKDGKWHIEKECKEIALIEFFNSVKKQGSIDKFKKLLKEKMKIKQ